MWYGLVYPNCNQSSTLSDLEHCNIHHRPVRTRPNVPDDERF